MQNVYWIKDFSGGQVSDTNPLDLAPNEFREMKNCVIGLGYAKKRPGLSTWCSALTDRAVGYVRRMVGGIVMYGATGPPTPTYNLFAATSDASPITVSNIPAGWSVYGADFDTTIFGDFTILTRSTSSGSASNDRMICLYWDSDTPMATYLGIDAPSEPSAAASVGSGLSEGDYQYVITLYDDTLGISSESAPCDAVDVTTTSTNKRVTLSNMPNESGKTTRIYRTIVGGEIFRYVTEVTANGDDYIDSTADEDLGEVFSNWDGSPPGAYKCVEMANSRLFAANSESGNAYRLIYSNIGRPGSVPSWNYIDMPDKLPIYDIIALGDKLVILQDGVVRVLYITGHPTEWVLSDALLLDGPISTNASCSCGQFIAFVGKSGVYLYDGVEFFNVAKKRIAESLYDDTTTKNHWLVYDQIRRRLYVCVDQVSSNDYWCYHFDVDAWTKWETDNDTISIYTSACLDEDGVVVISSAGSAVYKFDESATNDGSTSYPISMTIESGLMDMGLPEVTKLIRHFLIDLAWDAASGEDGQIKLTLTDEDDDTTIMTSNMATDSGVDRLRLSLPSMNGRTVQWKLEDQGQFDQFDLRGIGLKYNPRRIY